MCEKKAELKLPQTLGLVRKGGAVWCQPDSIEMQWNEDMGARRFGLLFCSSLWLKVMLKMKSFVSGRVALFVQASERCDTEVAAFHPYRIAE